MVVPPLLGSMLWLALWNHNKVFNQITDYHVQPSHARVLAPLPESVATLVRQCQRHRPGPYSIIGPDSNDVVNDELIAKHADWLPLRSLVMFNPLPPARRIHYLDVYRDQSVEGWLIAPIERDHENLAWLYTYLHDRFEKVETKVLDGWEASYFKPKAAPDSAPGASP